MNSAIHLGPARPGLRQRNFSGRAPNLGEVQPVLALMERRLEPEPVVLDGFVLNDLAGAGYVKEPFRLYDATPAVPTALPPLAMEAGAAPDAGPPPPLTGTGNVVREEPPAGEEVIHRYTDCDFTADPQPPASGRVSFALRIVPVGPESRPVDLRVPAGKQFATVLVHAFSQQFAVSPELWWAVRDPSLGTMG